MSILQRIIAIAFIWLCTTFAWVILGGTLLSRSSSDRSDHLRASVASTWGTEQRQLPPTAAFERVVTRRITTVEHDQPVIREVEQRDTVALTTEASRVDVRLDLAHRQKGLLWCSTYGVRFGGDYRFHNPSLEPQLVRFTLLFPARQAMYDDLRLTVDGQVLPIEHHGEAAWVTARVAGGASARLEVGYRSQGLDAWRYEFGDEVSQVRDFELTMHTNFKAIDVPPNTLSPTIKQPTATGWDLTWRYRDLVSGFAIGMTMPEKLQPGPLAGTISFFAPVSLLFFFFLMFLLTLLADIELHPMNYFFLAAAFFSFHLLLAYLVDHVSIHVAFAIAAVVSVALVVSYLRLVVGTRFALVQAGTAQLVYLVLFSYAFFFKGFTGLAITIVSVATLAVVMQMTGRIRWSERFATGARPLVPGPRA